MLGILPAPRAAALTDGPVTTDLDTTDVEVYGRKKRAWRITTRASGSGGPHVATWAQTEIVLAANLSDGTDDRRATAPDLLRRALVALPPAARASGPAGAVAETLARARAVGRWTVVPGLVLSLQPSAVRVLADL
jgi:hypothetical protein